LGDIMHEANTGNAPFIVRKKGEAPVVILGIRDYIKAFAPEPEILRIIGEESKQKGTHKITKRQIDAEIKAARRAVACPERHCSGQKRR
jgi:hypothetical protein